MQYKSANIMSTYLSKMRSARVKARQAKMSLQSWRHSYWVEDLSLKHLLGLNWHDKLPEAAGRPEHTQDVSLQNRLTVARQDFFELLIIQSIKCCRFKDVHAIGVTCTRKYMNNNPVRNKYTEYAKYVNGYLIFPEVCQHRTTPHQ